MTFEITPFTCKSYIPREGVNAKIWDTFYERIQFEHCPSSNEITEQVLEPLKRQGFEVAGYFLDELVNKERFRKVIWL